MSANGIIPDAGYGGIVTTTLPAPVGVTNAYVPPTSFTVSTPLKFYGMNCSANRFDPQQLNAFESEMLALAATLSPNGTWNAGTVTNLAAAFQTWAQTIVAGTLSLAPSSAYPGSSASNVTAATPGYVTAAIAAATGETFAIVNAADYPSLSTNDSRPITPAYWEAAFIGNLATNSAYPSSSSVLAATPSFVNAAIAAATTTIEATIPALKISSAYPADGDNTTAATPAYVAAARSAAEALIPALAVSSTYPDASDNTKAATPAYVAAAITAIGGVPTLTVSGSYPNDASNTTAATPAYVASARAAAISAAEAAIPALTVSGSYPNDSSNTTAATPAYVASARAAAVALIPALAIASTYPDNSDDAKAATPAYVHAAIVGAGGVSLTNGAAYPSSNDSTAATPLFVDNAIAGNGAYSSMYPAQIANNALFATPAFVGAAIAGAGGGGGGGLYDLSAGVPAYSAFTATGAMHSFTVTEAAGKAIFLTTGSDWSGVTAFYKTAPAAPYRIRLLLQAYFTDATTASGLVAGFTDGTKFEYIYIKASNAIQTLQNTTYNGSPSTWSENAPLTFYGHDIWFGLENDGTHVYVEYSVDGVNFLKMGSDTIAGAYLSDYTKVFFGAESNGFDMGFTLRCWDENGLTATFP